MPLSKVTRWVMIGLPIAFVITVLVIWYDSNAPPSLSEYIDSTRNTQEVKNFLTVYPTAKTELRDYYYHCDVAPCPPVSFLDYSYAESPNAEPNTARSVTLVVSFRDGTLEPTYFSVSCYDQLRDDSHVRIEGVSLSNVTDFVKNENCPPSSTS